MTLTTCHRQSIPVCTAIVPATHILGVPTDIVEYIFKSIDILLDAVCLSVVDRSFFDIGLGRITQLQKKRLGSWAGDRFVLVGDYCHGIPRKLRGYVADITKNDDGGVNMDGGHGSLYDIVAHFKVYDAPIPLRPHDPFRVSRRQRGSPLDVFYGKLKKSSEHDCLVKLFSPKVKTADDAPWVVCNLSKGLYIRADTLAGKDYDHTPFLKGDMNLGHVIMAFICYGETDCTLKAYGMYEGRWVGHAFEITTLDRLDETRLKEGQAWKDVSKRAVDLMNEILSESY